MCPFNLILIALRICSAPCFSFLGWFLYNCESVTILYLCCIECLRSSSVTYLSVCSSIWPNAIINTHMMYPCTDFEFWLGNFELGKCWSNNALQPKIYDLIELQIWKRWVFVPVVLNSRLRFDVITSGF